MSHMKLEKWTRRKKNHFNVSIALDLKDFGVFSHFVGVGLLKLSNMSKHFIVGRQKNKSCCPAVFQGWNPMCIGSIV